MKQNLNLTIGQEVVLKGYAEKYRYVGTNRVRNCKTGRIISVRQDQIEPVNNFDSKGIVMLLAVIASIALIIIALV